MNREIKFRIWSNDRKTMSYPSGFILDFYWVGWTTEHYLDAHSDEIDEDCILMQFTGLLDKNGKEIYEGDIVIVPDGYGGDSFYQECKGVIEYEAPEFWINTNNLSDYQWNQLEIIGNIHQDPKLL